MWTAEDEAELELLERYLDPDPLRQYCPHTPTAQQRAFIDLDVLEALYGGQAGGGKSDALLMGALQHVHVPGYGALLLRRTKPELEGRDGLIERAFDWLGPTDAHWNGSDGAAGSWTFPSGAKLFFGSMQHEADKRKYQGHAVQYVGYDETTHFLESQWTYLLTRIRRPKVGSLSKVPIRLRGGTNPGGIGHEWVKRRFGLRTDGTQDPKKARNDEAGELRHFVPAALADNPHLDVEAYRRSFTGVDQTTRDQLERGLWVRDGKGLVYAFAPSRNLIPLEEWLELEQLPGWHFLFWIDLGASQAKPTTAFGILAWNDFDPRVIQVTSWAEAGLIPSDDAERIAAARAERDIEWVVLDEGALGKGYGGEFRQRFGEGFILAAKKTDKLGHRRLMNGDLQRGRLLIVEGQNDDLVEELESLPWNETGTDNARGFANHLTDGLLYGWRSSLGHAAEHPANEPAHGTPEWSQHEQRRMERACRDQQDQERAWHEAETETTSQEGETWYETG